MALTHILSIVLQDTSGRYATAFAGYGVTDIDTFMLLDDYTDPFDLDGKEARLNKIELRLLSMLQQWFRNQDSPDLSTWFNLDHVTFTQYWKTTTKSHTPSGVTSGASNYVTDHAANFLKGIKRDIKQYDQFKDDKNWLTWKVHVENIASTHGIEHLLDPTYTPTSKEEIDKYDIEQKYLYSILSQCLHTSKSKKELRTHQKSKDANAVWAALINSYETGVTGTLMEEKLEKALEQYILVADKWNKPLATFLTTWSLKVMELEDFKNKSLTDKEKIDYLEKAIRGHAKLNKATTSSTTIFTNWS
jgi:hypothetical protein